MAKVDDLSRSLTTLDQEVTLICIVELSRSSWLIAGIYGGYRYIDASGRHLDSPPRLVGEYAYESFLKGNCIAMHAAVMYRRDRLEEVGGFDTGLRPARITSCICVSHVDTVSR